MFPQMPVTATWIARGAFGPYWRLVTAPCPFCGAKYHVHGGGDGPEPSLGLRVAHCGPHKAFGPECAPERIVTGRKECAVEHAPQYELVVPDEAFMRSVVEWARSDPRYARWPHLRTLTAELEARLDGHSVEVTPTLRPDQEN